jgi:acyl dehydratase
VSDLYEQLQAFEGRPIGQRRVAPDIVGAPMIRHLCRAIEDDNPIYVDAEAARAAGHPGVVAPPTMLQSWTTLDRRERPLPPYQMQEELRDLLAEHGFKTVVATNCDQEYDRYLREGDEITSTAVLSSISPEKRTRFGPGHFVTAAFSYSDQYGESVGRMALRCLVFRPTDAEASGQPRSTAGHADSDASKPRLAASPADAAVGDRLPDLTIAITPTLIIAGALATMDFNVIHHDRDRAQADGSKDIIMNILTTNNLVGRYVTDWAGPASRLRSVALQLGVPNFPGDEMTFHGEVAAREPDEAGTLLQVRLRGVNSLGNHAVATVDLTV